MIHPDLHTQPVLLDRQQHRLLRFRRDANDMARFANLNSCFVVVGEFAEACKEYPLVWVRAGEDGQGVQQVAPVAVFGLTKQSNLCIEQQSAQQWRWRTGYAPVVLRVHPFALGRSGDAQWAMCHDASSPCFSLTEGEPLFGADGEPSALTLDVQRQLEQIETEVERTRQAGRELLQRNLLRDMRFDVTLPDGGTLSVDGFLTLDEKRFGELADAEVLAMHKSGLLALIHIHQVSLSNMRRLAQWHIDRHGATNAVQAAPSP